MPSLRPAERPEQVLDVLRQHEAELRRRRVKSLYLFGSVARGEASERSDVDLLVDFEPVVGLFAFLHLKRFLEEILDRPVDLVTTGALRPQWRDQVLREAVRAA